ncbi:MAG: DUF6455 family protein [Pseudolabrys sp.]
MYAQQVQEQHYPGLEPILGAVARWVTELRRKLKVENEFRECGSEEVARVARDLGVSAEELKELAGKSPESTELLAKMLKTLGVDAKRVTAAKPGVMRDLQRVCIACALRDRCIHELADGTAGQHFHEFCPNAYTLDALIEEQRQMH